MTITLADVSDPAARFTVLIGVLWFIAWCVTALAVFRRDWPDQMVHNLAGAAGLITLLLSSYLLAVRLRRLDAGVREGYAAALQQTNTLLRDLVDQDDLTGLRNRRFFLRSLEEEFERAQRQDRGLGLLVADLDGFKQVNDEFGHQVGDRVLREFARRLESSANDGEIVCRIGGDEFAVLVAGAGYADAERLADRIRGLSAGPVPWEPDVEGPAAIHASVGIAVLDPAVATASALLNRADQSLYAEKRRYSRSQRRTRAG